MSLRTNLDMDVLRTFVMGFELGSFARAADRLGRSQSAISSQLRKLEEQVGHTLVQKSGRGLVLTTAGESLLSYARRLLELNDEALDTVRGSDLEGWVRLGQLMIKLGQFNKAEELYEILLKQATNEREKADLFHQLGWTKTDQGKYAEAIEFYEK